MNNVLKMWETLGKDLKSRDEIISHVSMWRFAQRSLFWNALDEHAQITVAGRMERMKWPDALCFVTLEAWNETFERVWKEVQSAGKE